jgi:glycosyltransferase involved in cell wall biosynthesis
MTAAASLPIAWRRLGAAIRSAEPEVVHVNDHRGMLLAGPAARIARRPVVWHLHSTDVSGGLVERTAGRLASAIVGPSAAALSGLAGALAHIPTTVVRPPVDDEIRRLAPARPGGAGRLVTAARLHPAKGLDTAVRAVALLAAQGRVVHLDVFGAAQRGAEAHAAELHRLAADLRVVDQVTFHGHVDSPHEQWLHADLYVQPSRAETFGIGVAEAMCLGLPVVATRVGGLPELVDDGVTGQLVAPEDPEALAHAIADVLDDPERAATMGRAGRAATAGLSAARAVDDLLQVWDRVRRR